MVNGFFEQPPGLFRLCRKSANFSTDKQAMKLTLSLKHFLELKGEKVDLQKLEPKFTALYLQYMGQLDTATRILTTTGQVFSDNDMEGYIERVSADNSRIDFLIFDVSTQQLLGEVVLLDIDSRNRSAHIRIAIARQENFGKGYGSEAMLLALQYGFGMQAMHRIELEVLSYNERAIHVYEKLGFRKEGLKRDGCYYNHRYHDIITMSMLDHEFRQQYLAGIAPLESLIP